MRLFVGPYLPAAAVAMIAGTLLLAGLRAGVRGERVDAAQLVACLAAAAGLMPLTLLVTGLAAWGGAALAQALLTPLGLALLYAYGRAGSAPDRRPQARYGADEPHRLSLVSPVAVPLWLRGPALPRFLGALALAVALVGAGLVLRPLLPEADPGTPFHALHRAVSRLWFGTLPLYNTVALAANPFANTFGGPPVLAAALLPLAALRYAAALLAWRLLGIVLVLAAALLLLRAYRLPLRSWPAAGLVLLLLAFGPLTQALAEGRVTPLLLLLAAGGLYALLRGRDATLGACLGVAGALHPPMLLLLGFPLAQRRWRALAAFVLAIAASLLVAGWPAHQVYLAHVAPALALSTPWPQNQSLPAFVHRLLVPEQLALRPAGGGLAGLAALILSLALLALTAWLTWRGRLGPDRAYALWLVAALLAAPVTWAPEHALLLVALFVPLAASGGTPWPAAACYALGVALLAHGDPLALHGDVARGPFWQLALSAQLYGALVVYVGTLRCVRA
jgi:hypothetical protein